MIHREHPEAFAEETYEDNGEQLQKLLAAFGTLRKSQTAPPVKAKATAAKPATALKRPAGAEAIVVKSTTALKRPAGAKEQDSPALKR